RSSDLSPRDLRRSPCRGVGDGPFRGGVHGIVSTRSGVDAVSSLAATNRCAVRLGGTRSLFQAESNNATLACISARSLRNESAGLAQTCTCSNHQTHATAPALATKSGMIGIPRAVNIASASGVVAALAASTMALALMS